MNARTIRAAFAGLLLLASMPAAADGSFGLGVKAGTLGLGLEGTWRPLPYMDVRIGANLWDHSETSSEAGVDYDATLNLDTFYATGNFRFPASPFRLTAGLYQNGNELKLTSLNTEGTIEIGDISYPAADVGTLRSTTSFAGTSPYLGFGYDLLFASQIGLNLDLGVLWQGDPEVTMTADGSLASNPVFQASLEQERQQIEDAFKDYKAWPVVSLGFVFNF
jgi:hypothetical protein